VSDPGQVQSAVQSVTSALGDFDCLVNAAGVARGGPIAEWTLEQWNHLHSIHVGGTFLVCQSVLPGMQAKGSGAIVNVTSIAGSRVHPFAGTAYSTSKAALAALTREMAADFGPLGIRVNAIAPGEIDTAMLSPGTEKIVENIPMHRLGTPDEVAKIIYVLCTETASYVNGAEIHINGGQHV